MALSTRTAGPAPRALPITPVGRATAGEGR